MGAAIDKVKAKYADLVAQLADMDAQLVTIEGQEDVKKNELRERQGLLAERIRSAYDTDRTSLLESFLSGGTFTDLLTEMSAFIDVGEQDKALAQQIARDQETLAALHQNVTDTRDSTNVLRQETAAQKRTLDASLLGLKAAKAELRKLEKETQKNLSIQRATFAKIARNKANAAKALQIAAKAQKQLASKISEIVRKQSQAGRIPSEYNGTLSWPMSGNVTQNFGCTGFSWEPPYGDCPHFHSGIDIVAPRARRSARRATAWSPTSAGTMPTAPTRPGSSSSPTARASRPGTPTCDRRIRAGSRPAARSRPARWSGTRATPAIPPAPICTGPSASTGTSSTRACSSRPRDPGRLTRPPPLTERSHERYPPLTDGGRTPC